MRSIVVLTALVSAAVATALPLTASAQIKSPGAHADYRVELEPRLDIAFFRYGGAGYGRFNSRDSFYFGSAEAGAGFNVAIKIVDPGFIPKLNNTVSIAFGVDFTSCQFCTRSSFRVYNPVTLKWAFYFDPKFSAFADLGFMLRTDGFYKEVYPDFVAELGARYHINQHVALSARIGYPFFTFGPSFFL
jgi:hypothetical protein